MKLTDLHPSFIGRGGDGITDKDGNPVPHQKGVGLTCDCPCGNTECLPLYVQFENPLEGEQVQGNQPRWHREGDTFETLTLSPSIQRIGGCGFHGYIRNGEIIEV